MKDLPIVPNSDGSIRAERWSGCFLQDGLTAASTVRPQGSEASGWLRLTLAALHPTCGYSGLRDVGKEARASQTFPSLRTCKGPRPSFCWSAVLRICTAARDPAGPEDPTLRPPFSSSSLQSLHEYPPLMRGGREGLFPGNRALSRSPRQHHTRAQVPLFQPQSTKILPTRSQVQNDAQSAAAWRTMPTGHSCLCPSAVSVHPGLKPSFLWTSSESRSCLPRP